MISVDEALTILRGHRLVLPAEVVALDKALGRELAQDVRAKVTVPPHDASAMDGYAVRGADVGEQGARLRVIGEAPAGLPFSGTVDEGEAVRLFTGSIVPDGADHIVIQEDVSREGETIMLTRKQGKVLHIRPSGGDFSSGSVVLGAGARLGPPHLAVAAAADHATLPVRRRARVAIIANGNELRAPGSNPASGDVIASNYYGLAALLREWGAQPIDLGIARDTPEDIAAHIERAQDADIIVPVGGASVGDHDHMFGVFKSAGYEALFRKIAVKPGKPTWFAVKGEQLVLGLPGNPASAYVCARLFLRALLSKRNSLAGDNAVLGGELPANGPRETFLRATVSTGEDGVRRVAALPRQDSSLITPFLEANCLIRRMPGVSAAKSGERVLAIPLD